MNINTMIPGPYGFRPSDLPTLLLSHAAIVKNEIVALDITTATAAKYGVVQGSRAIIAADRTNEVVFYAVAQEAVAANKPFRVLWEGWVEAKADVNGVNPEVGLSVSTSGELVDLVAVEAAAPGAADGFKVLAVAPEAIAGAATGRVWFKGDGFGAFAG